MILVHLVVAVLASTDAGHVVSVDDAFTHPGDAGVGDQAAQLQQLGFDQVDRAELLSGDGGWVHAGPGCFAPTPKCIAAGKRDASLEASNAALSSNPTGLTWVWITLAIGLAIGLVGGVSLDRWLPR